MENFIATLIGLISCVYCWRMGFNAGQKFSEIKAIKKEINKIKNPNEIIYIKGRISINEVVKIVKNNVHPQNAKLS